MKKILICLVLLVLFVHFISCNEKGDYQFLIQMNDGTIVKAWSVSPAGGGLVVSPAWNEGNSYYLSSSQYTKAEYVGVKHKANESNIK